jgi:hypothetical protein
LPPLDADRWAGARPAGPWQDVRINDGSVVPGSQQDENAQERLRALQRRAFAADGDAAGDGEVARAIRELQAEIAAATAAEPGGDAAEPVRMPAGAPADNSSETEISPGDPPTPPAVPGARTPATPRGRRALLVAGGERRHGGHPY